MFGPFLFFDGKIPLIYHKRLFLDSQNERVSWPITSISFNGVFQRQSHSTSFKWCVGKKKEKEIAFMECRLCFGHITFDWVLGASQQSFEVYIIIPNFIGEKTETQRFYVICSKPNIYRVVELEFEPMPAEFLRLFSFSWHSAQLSPVSRSTTVVKILLLLLAVNASHEP